MQDQVKEAWRSKVYVDLKDRVERKGEDILTAIHDMMNELETDMTVYHGKVAKGLVLNFAMDLLRAYRTIQDYSIKG